MNSKPQNAELLPVSNSDRAIDKFLPLAYVAGGAIVIGVAIPATIAIVGFSTGGVAAGSVAAGIQSGIGNVAAGSAFAALQSLGTTPLVSGAIGATVGATGAGVMIVVKDSAGKLCTANMPLVNEALRGAWELPDLLWDVFRTAPLGCIEK